MTETKDTRSEEKLNWMVFWNNSIGQFGGVVDMGLSEEEARKIVAKNNGNPEAKYKYECKEI
ncbi:hypothetical protein FWH13_04025 [Candidatus Saccharibacteria bacterium]|nr:hypothetical protein [Candidatus Saccharibacteria bacterium]